MANHTMEHAIPHHFETAEQAYDAAKLGVWLFMVTEVLMFGGLFCAYIVFRSLYPDMFDAASQHLNRVLGGINTVALICSSLTMARAVNWTRHDEHRKAQKMLLATLFFACVFMVIKYFEYTHKIHEGLLPGAHFHFEGLKHPKTPLFFSLYFMMTGLHGVHVLTGMILIFWIFLKSRKGAFSSKYYTPVELVGIFWHLVDLVWIYLFPLLYLIGQAHG